MHGADTSWSPLEVAKLLASILTPISVALLGWLISSQLKRLEHAQWANQKLIEKRLEIFDAVAPQLNKLLCFFTWIGSWKTTTPDEVLAAKRHLDSILHVYRYIFESVVFEKYEVFMDLLFETYTGAGMDAKIRSDIASRYGDRIHHASYDWNPTWNTRFSTEEVGDRARLRAAYLDLMSTLQSSIEGA